MKHLVTKTLFALGASGALLLAQTPTPKSTDPQTAPTGANDTQMASKVRQALMDDQTTSTDAHNVRVSSHNGMVTLKGKVASDTEKDAMIAKAKQVAGDSNVKDEITVKSK
jgi:hyperosmotically inducible protein